MGGVGGGHAQGWRQLQLSARSLRTARGRALALVPDGVADHVFGAAVGGERQHWFCELPSLSGARDAGLGHASGRRTFPAAAGGAALSADRDHWQHVGDPGGRRAPGVPLDCGVRHPASERRPPLRFPSRCFPPELDFLGESRSCHPLRALRLLRLLQRLLSRGGDSRSWAGDPSRHPDLHYERRRALRLHDIVFRQRH